VVAIIGILAAIAIPQFQRYRERAFDGRAQSDLRNMMTAQEAHFTDNEAYAADIAALEAFGFRPSDGVVASVVDGDASAWSGTTCHPAGTLVYSYDSDGANNGITSAAGTCS
jgi:Tfp pilus assembly protein PilE